MQIKITIKNREVKISLFQKNKILDEIVFHEENNILEKLLTNICCNDERKTIMSDFVKQSDDWFTFLNKIKKTTINDRGSPEPSHSQE